MVKIGRQKSRPNTLVSASSVRWRTLAENVYYTEIRNDINNIDWENELRGKNTEESWEILENVVKESIERNIPMQKVGKTFKKKWMTKETMNVVKEKHKAYKKYRKLRTNESKDDYNRAKQKAIYATKKARTDFETRIANNIKENPKEFYSYVNNKTTVRSEIAVLKNRNGELAILPHEKADMLNNYFASVFTKEDTYNIPEPEPQVVQSSLSTIIVTEQMVRDRLKEQKPGKSAGPDGIHSRVVVETQEQLVRPLTMIFNKSLKEGVVPNSWKEAEVVPIFKKGKRDDPGNYRPVSLTSGKIMEKIVRKEIVDHLERNEIISDVQHGFVQGKSCQTQLLTVTEEWTRWMEERKPFDCLYFDYKKAFNSVPHMRLMRKIENWNNWASTKMDQEFDYKSKSRRSSFRMEKSDIWDPARFGVGAHPVCAVHQRSTTGSGISSCSFRRRHNGV